MRYDLHVHTKFSRCSNLEPAKILQAAKSKGLDGVAITDHNTIRGALEVKRLNKDKSFEVIVGEEVETEYGDVLVYYLKDEIAAGKLADVLENAKKQGAIISLAHPLDILRKSFPRDMIRSLSKKINALETFNSRTLNPLFNDYAYELSKDLRLASIAGSDAHFWFEVGSAVTIFKGSLRSAIGKRATTTEGSAMMGPIGIAMTFLRKNLGIL